MGDKVEKIIIATKNKGKVEDFKKLFGNQREVLSLLDFVENEDIAETGKTFEENAIIKAEYIAKKYDEIVVADDSGLVIDALDGRPGIYSARYAGPSKDDNANINKVLEEMKDIRNEKRTARFICALAVAKPKAKTDVVVGECNGMIAMEPRGENGFGYDPIFIPEHRSQTLAQLSADVKNQISHRAAAMQKLKVHFKEFI